MVLTKIQIESNFDTILISKNVNPHHKYPNGIKNKSKGDTRPTLVAKYPLAVKFAGLVIASSEILVEDITQIDT